MWICEKCGFCNSNNDESCSNCGYRKQNKEKEKKKGIPPKNAVLISIVFAVTVMIIWLFQLRGNNTENSNLSAETAPIIMEVTPTHTHSPTPTPAATPEPTAEPAEIGSREDLILTGTVYYNDDGLKKVLFTNATASSVFSETNGFSYPPTNAIRDDTKWPWVEGAAGDGTGENLILSFSKSETITMLGLHLGFETAYARNNRPRVLQFDFSDGSSLQFEFEDYNQMQYVRFSHPVTTSFVRITILSVYPSNMDNDACITKVYAYTE